MTSLYRVVCGISQEKNEIYAAIHKAEKGLHQNMFWSLQMEHPEVKDMRQIGGSMYLDDLDSGPRFTIAAEVLKNSATDLKALLTDKVLQVFAQMKAQGKDSSLQMYLTDVEHYAKLDPSSAIAARVSQEAKEELERRRRKEERVMLERHAEATLPAWETFSKSLQRRLELFNANVRRPEIKRFRIIGRFTIELAQAATRQVFNIQMRFHYYCVDA